MSEDQAPYSLAPTRVFVDGRQVDVVPRSWTPPEPQMAPMRHEGAELSPFEPPAEVEEPIEQRQPKDEETRYWQWLDHFHSLSRADLAGRQEAQKVSDRTLERRRYRLVTGRDYISPVEDGTDRRRSYRG